MLQNRLWNFSQAPQRVNSAPPFRQMCWGARSPVLVLREESVRGESPVLKLREETVCGGSPVLVLREESVCGVLKLLVLSNEEGGVVKE